MLAGKFVLITTLLAGKKESGPGNLMRRDSCGPITTKFCPFAQGLTVKVLAQIWKNTSN